MINNIGIYIHIPFCVSKCDYCDFFSTSDWDEIIIEEYVEALIIELIEQSKSFTDQKIESIFFGGGTPSLLSHKQVEKIIETLQHNFFLEADIEISMESNPATLSYEKVAAYKAIGINRFSLGVQSFQDEELKILGRAHSVEDIWQTLEIFKKLNLDNYNLDLIFGIPGQSVEKWAQNLKLAVDCEAKHISAYLLQLGKTTNLYKRIEKAEINLCDEDLENDMYQYSIDYLKDRDFKHYELSNFAKASYSCKHNLLYWNAQNYLGIGAGAVSFYMGKRIKNSLNLKKYIYEMKTHKRCEQSILESMDQQNLVLDAIILGLRKTEGINITEFENRFGTDIRIAFSQAIKICEDNNLLYMSKKNIKLSRKGYFLSNQVFRLFIK